MKKDVYELTNAQKSIWLTEQYLKGTSIGNISGIIYINQNVDFKKLELSIREFVHRNDSMHTRILVDDGSPKQFFANYEDINFSIELHKLNSHDDVEVLANKIASTPFKLLDSNLFTFDLFILPNGQGRTYYFYSSYYW